MSTEHQTLIDDCVAREGRLTDREREFIDSAGRQLAEGRPLTQRQADWLDDIWERATANG